MHTIGIKELQTNPGKLSHALLHNEYMLITRRGEPLGVALPFGLPLLEHGMKNWVALKAFQAGDLSLGQLGKVLGKNKYETLALLGELNIPFADYNLQEDLQTLEALFSA